MTAKGYTVTKPVSPAKRRNHIRRGIISGLVIGFLVGCAMDFPMFADAWVYRDSVGHAIGWSIFTAFASLQFGFPLMVIGAVIGGAVGRFRGRNTGSV
jgi:cell division protein FtsX